MQKKLFLLIAICGFINTGIWSNNNIILIKRGKIKTPIGQSQIPITADINGSELGIHFQTTDHVQITIYGPEGIVYQCYTSSESNKSIYIDLTHHQEGEYTIQYNDTKGNVLEGNFWKDEN